jgi:hypothetical protein
VSFGFNAQTGRGQFEYNRHSAEKAAWHSIELTLVSIVNTASCPGGQTATFEGTMRRKGQTACTTQTPCCEFTVEVEDCGEPGSSDKLTFAPATPGDVNCPELRTGTLDRGNIQIH